MVGGALVCDDSWELGSNLYDTLSLCSGNVMVGGAQVCDDNWELGM
jgi:hypothetical protein